MESSELGPNDGWRVFVHNGEHATIKYRVRVVCDEFYGRSTCQAFCKPRNDHFGHWYCSPDAEKICLDGWTGSNCDKGITVLQLNMSSIVENDISARPEPFSTIDAESEK